MLVEKPPCNFQLGIYFFSSHYFRRFIVRIFLALLFSLYCISYSWPILYETLQVPSLAVGDPERNHVESAGLRCRISPGTFWINPSAESTHVQVCGSCWFIPGSSRTKYCHPNWCPCYADENKVIYILYIRQNWSFSVVYFCFRAIQNLIFLRFKDEYTFSITNSSSL